MENLKNHIDKYPKIYLFSFVLFVILYSFIVWKLPECYTYYYSKISAKDQLLYIKDLRSTLFTISTGILALIGIYLTWRRTMAIDYQNKINESKLFFDKNSSDNNLILQQFSKASELLFKDDNFPSRISGIYLFEKIMNSSEDYHIQIIEIFSAIIRKKRTIDIEKYKTNYFSELEIDFIRKNWATNLEDEINIILTVLVRRNNMKSVCDLNSTNFIDIHKENLNLQHSNVKNTVFDLSVLPYSNFSKSKLNFAFFRGANLHRANFENSDLSNTNFNSAHLFNSKFNHSIIYVTDFTNSKLYSADFEFSRISFANFKDSHLKDANFRNIKLYIEDEDRANSEDEIRNFIGDLSQGSVLKGIKLNEEIISIIKVEYEDLYKRIYGNLTEDEIKIVEGEG